MGLVRLRTCMNMYVTDNNGFLMKSNKRTRIKYPKHEPSIISSQKHISNYSNMHLHISDIFNMMEHL